jgi:hypothetical protein
MHLLRSPRRVRLSRLLTVSALTALAALAPAVGTDGGGRADAAMAAPGTAEPTPERSSDERDDTANDESGTDEPGSDRSDTGESGTDESGTGGSGGDATGTVPPGGKDGNNNGLDVLGRDCSNSDLKPHDGFQESPACVSTQMGEVAAEDELPSLLITEAPKTVEVGESFQMQVSTRNLVRDRFLGAAEGGYYLESSFLDDEGLQRGHFHTACRLLRSTDEAPDSGQAPAFFLATQDNKGGAEPDTVTIEVPGIDTAGELQCTSWAGDGSHRIPMMTKANETPAVDSVRITVTE